MKRYIMYECETCGKKSTTYDEIFECEASHIGLTSKEKGNGRVYEFTTYSKISVNNCSKYS